MFTKRILIEKIGKTAIQLAKALNPIHSISFQRPKILVVIRPLRLFRERYIEIDSHIDIDSLAERYSVYQNKKQNIWTACWEYLMGLYGHYLKYIYEKCSLIAIYDAAGNFSDEQFFFYIFIEKQIDYIDCFDKYIVLYRENKNNYKAKDLFIHDNAGVYTPLIHIGVKQTRELGVSEQMFCLTKTKHQNSFG